MLSISRKSLKQPNSMTRLKRGDLLAAPVDQLLQAPSQGEVALLVQEALVASVEPTACSIKDVLVDREAIV